MALLLANTGKPAEAMKAYESALAIRQKLANSNPTVAEFQKHLAGCHSNIAVLLRNLGQPAEAMKAHERRWRSFRSWPTPTPRSPSSRTAWRAAFHSIALLLRDIWETGRGDKDSREALAIQQKLADANPTVTDFQSNLALSLSNIGHPAARYRETGRGDEGAGTGTGDLSEAGRLEPHRHRVPAQTWR